MSSAVLQATVQACVLTATSNILAQLISSYRSDKPYVVDWVPVLHFILYTALNSPPNYLWQQYLESTFPGHSLQPSTSAIEAAAASDEKELDAEQKAHTILESRLNVPNTLTKFVLDQTIGAVINTVMFSFVIAGFQGADFNQAALIAQQDFWPLMRAGWKLWPAVSALNFTMVKTVEGRTLVGSLAGMGWNIYLSLVAGAAKE